ncbi:FAD-dependent oxidoreductase [Mycobacterium sp. 21AC1]|uniref:NAD(P)/FAD-dependent oxidoreductase n=1 Tax=[Mycobacterium] appelbergii TaxID=2939269 RepID=UPI0029394C3E|nr:FAD-dependent oxidoreductase [Mycobacterium sp. 21AC1]MDV3130121.1 FAD-dependent oxidoreductase [Mycobacterium sp. 21AC1]
MAGRIDVVVIGGGYAGVMAANRLTQRDDVAVTLINPRPSFVERIRLHQVVSGSDDAVTGYGQVLGAGVRLLVDTVTRIDSADRRVTLAGGRTVGYDYLIYAVGSGSADTRIPGGPEFTYPIGTLEHAQRLAGVLRTAPATVEVTVVGGGPTGIEISAELAEQGRKVVLVCGATLAPYLHPRGRRAVARRLDKLGVAVLDGHGAQVTAVQRDSVHLADGRMLASAVTIWTAGFAVPDLAMRSALSTDAAGRLITDETLTSVDDDRIVAAGDAAAPSNLPLRMSCQAAMPLGARAADTVLARIAHEQPADLDVGFFGMCIGLGPRAATVQLATKDDTAGRFIISGRLAAWIKQRSYTGLTGHLADEAREPGSYTWNFKDARRRQRVAGRNARAAPNEASQLKARP